MVALLVTGWLKVTMMGAPTPMVSPLAWGVTSAICRARSGLAVVNVLVAVVAPAVALTV